MAAVDVSAPNMSTGAKADQPSASTTTPTSSAAVPEPAYCDALMTRARSPVKPSIR